MSYAQTPSKKALSLLYSHKTKTGLKLDNSKQSVLLLKNTQTSKEEFAITETLWWKLRIGLESSLCKDSCKNKWNLTFHSKGSARFSKENKEKNINSKATFLQHFVQFQLAQTSKEELTIIERKSLWWKLRIWESHHRHPICNVTQIRPILSYHSVRVCSILKLVGE